MSSLCFPSIFSRPQWFNAGFWRHNKNTPNLKTYSKIFLIDWFSIIKPNFARPNFRRKQVIYFMSVPWIMKRTPSRETRHCYANKPCPFHCGRLTWSVSRGKCITWPVLGAWLRNLKHSKPRLLTNQKAPCLFYGGSLLWGRDRLHWLSDTVKAVKYR